MASRPAWTIRDGKVTAEYFDFDWNGGFAVVQKQKNITALHQAIKEKYKEDALEVSSKSMDQIGRDIGAFSLKMDGVYIENIFQAAKKYEKGGPFLDLLKTSPKEAKRDKRHYNSGMLTAFVIDETEWPLTPKTAFYDFIYEKALLQNYGDTLNLEKYGWFTDIEFNPKKSINCQARSAAIYKLLQKENAFSALLKMQTWISFHKAHIES